jgi:hypothetical protein
VTESGAKAHRQHLRLRLSQRIGAYAESYGWEDGICHSGLLRHESDTFVIVHLAELVLIAAVVEEVVVRWEREAPPLNPIW